VIACPLPVTLKTNCKVAKSAAPAGNAICRYDDVEARRRRSRVGDVSRGYRLVEIERRRDMAAPVLANSVAAPRENATLTPPVDKSVTVIVAWVTPGVGLTALA
jgi:hypothetical protein